MNAGEGDGGGIVPPAEHLEIPPQEIERGLRRQGGAFRSRPPSAMVPFKTGSGFGNWLFAQFADDPDAYHAMHCSFIRYTRTFKIKQLVRRGRRFRGIQRLYFLQGLHIIAATIKQKNYIGRVFQAEQDRLFPK